RRESPHRAGEENLTRRTGFGGTGIDNEVGIVAGGFVEVRGPQGTRLVELVNDRSTLGRATTNDVVVLLDATVSRLHAVIERYPTGFCVRDLGSATRPARP